MNVALAREIYGGVPWMVDSQTFKSLFELLHDFKKGATFSEKEIKANAICLFDVRSATKIITETYELNDDYRGDDLIYVINLNGVITKNGGMSSYGMTHLASRLLKFDADSRVIGGVIVVDSGGGSSYGQEIMSHALSIRKKPVVSIIERAGVAASAAYGIISHTDEIISESETNIVGSLGTMMAFAGNPDKSVDSNGAKYVTMYATASVKKNEWYEEAINKDNYKIAIDEILDPSNMRFLTDIKKSRPSVLDTQLDGSIYEAGKVIGSLVDRIGSFDDAVNKVIMLSKNEKKSINNNKTTKAMTAQEFKTQHPAAYQEVFNAGVAAEADRTGAWLAHAETDLTAVKAGIEGGKEINQTLRENFLVKANSKTSLGSLKNDSAPDFATQESKNEIVEQTEADQFYAEVDKSLK